MTPTDPLRPPSPPSADARVRIAIALLREALVAAKASQRDSWDFALEIAALRALGLTNTDLRLLLSQGYVEHGAERVAARGQRRAFRRLATLALPDTTCFVLTAQGAALANQLEHESAPDGRGSGLSLSRRAVPCWDGELRQLRWEDRVVKQLRRPALNQETILAVLEEEGWPPRIDDPLPQAPGQDPKVRLHDAIKGLNRHHLQRVLCFQGDGTGSGVTWRLLHDHALHASPLRPHNAP